MRYQKINFALGFVAAGGLAAGLTLTNLSSMSETAEPQTAKEATAKPDAAEPPASAENDRAHGFKIHDAAEFPPDAQWLQSQPLTIAGLKGQVVVVHFWTNGCINCIHNYPVYQAWQKKYSADKVTIIGVHTPESLAEAPAETVLAKARANQLKFPIVLDNSGAVWRSWENRYWPTIYLIDKQGRVRWGWEGELHLDTTSGKEFAEKLEALVKEPS